MTMSAPDIYDRIGIALIDGKRAAEAAGRKMYGSDIVDLLRREFPTLQEANGKAHPGQSGCIPATKATPEAIYQAYPRHVGRKTALRAIQTAAKQLEKEGLPDQKPLEYLLDRVKAYAAAVAEWPATDRQFVPHPSTWMNQGRWADAASEWKRGTATASQPRDYSKL